jgi:signal transduction histidine kinase
VTRAALLRGLGLALGAALAVAAIVLAAYDRAGALETIEILAPLGLATVALTQWVLARRGRLGSLRRQAFVTAALALGPLVVTLALFVQMMFVSAHDALLAGLAAMYSGLLGLWAGRLLSRRVMEDAEARRAESEAARRALIAAVSHDLRTPVTALRLLAEAVDDEIGDPETRREYVRRLGVTVRAASAGSSVEIEVADTGEGIARADRVRVFEPFQQGAGRAARSDGSAGLGLAISRAIVEAHGGRIWIVDEPGGDAQVGARVRFSLPGEAPSPLAA